MKFREFLAEQAMTFTHVIRVDGNKYSIDDTENLNKLVFGSLSHKDKELNLDDISVAVKNKNPNVELKFTITNLKRKLWGEARDIIDSLKNTK